jgi:hypothetical protein
MHVPSTKQDSTKLLVYPTLSLPNPPFNRSQVLAVHPQPHRDVPVRHANHIDRRVRPEERQEPDAVPLSAAGSHLPVQQVVQGPVLSIILAILGRSKSSSFLTQPYEEDGQNPFFGLSAERIRKHAQRERKRHCFYSVLSDVRTLPSFASIAFF